MICFGESSTCLEAPAPAHFLKIWATKKKQKNKIWTFLICYEFTDTNDCWLKVTVKCVFHSWGPSCGWNNSMLSFGYYCLWSQKCWMCWPVNKSPRSWTPVATEAKWDRGSRKYQPQFFNQRAAVEMADWRDWRGPHTELSVFQVQKLKAGEGRKIESKVISQTTCLSRPSREMRFFICL